MRVDDLRPREAPSPRVARRKLAPGSLPVGLPLLGAVVVVLVIDRLLGLTRFALAPSAGVSVPGIATSVLLIADAAVACLVLLVLLAVRALRRPRGPRGLIAVVFLTALVGLQLGAAVIGRLTSVTLPTDSYLARALLMTGATNAALLVLGSLAEHRRSVGERSAARARAEALAASGRDAIERLRADVSARVREVLGDALESIGGAGPSGAGASGGGARLRALADEVIRPLGHRLAAAPALLADVRPEVPPLRWRDTLRDVARRPAVPARTLAVTSGTLALLRTVVTDQDAVREVAPIGPLPVDGGAVAVSVDWLPLVASLTELTLIVGLTWWGAARLARVLEDTGLPTSRRAAARAWATTMLALLVIATLAVAAPAVAAQLIEGTGVGSLGVALVATSLPLVAVTLGATAVRAVEDARGALDADLARHTDAVARTAARLQAVLGHEQQRLARSLHADVQSAVNAAGIALDRADREGRVTPELVEDLAGRIAAAVERFLAEGGSDLPLCDRLEDVRRLWRGVCEVRVDVDGATRERVDGDPITRDLVVDLVAEACANAVVHGAASRVDVLVGPGADGEVALTVRDDGTRRAGGAVAEGATGGVARTGLGSELLRASCTRSALVLADDGAVLTAGVPLG